MEPIKEEEKVEPKVEQKVEPIEIKEVKSEVSVPIQIEKEKKPRTEAQIVATKRLVEANKAKRKITIIDTPKEPNVEHKEEPKVAPIAPKEPNVYDMLKQMEDRISQLTQKKKKEPQPKPVKEPKPKKLQKEESSDSESESESDDDAYVEKYTQKAEKRFQAVQAIEQRLQQAKSKPKGRYDHLTLF
jgi:hypothetical protein